jgi:thiol-disulfide isomerase/thioredoxin
MTPIFAMLSAVVAFNRPIRLVQGKSRCVFHLRPASSRFAAVCLLSLPLRGPSVDQANAGTMLSAAHTPAAAPNFVGIQAWFNSAPLNIADLRGKVVLVDFWTYGCYNCVNTLPYVTRLYDTYKDKGLVVVGVHTPELPFEKSAGNVQAAIKRHGIRYPVAQDNEYATWNAYRNQYWPAQYIVDQTGKIVFAHAGEGQYDEIERTVQKLFDVNG